MSLRWWRRAASAEDAREKLAICRRQLHDAERQAAAAVREAARLRQQLTVVGEHADRLAADRKRLTAAVEGVRQAIAEMEAFARESGVESWWAPRLRRAIDGKQAT